jgi:hypothetical protein
MPVKLRDWLGGCVDREGFVETLRTEIRRRIEDGRFDMGRTDIEQIGRKSRMSPEEAANHFMDIRGRVWEGNVVPRSDQRWAEVTFDREWFWQQHGIRPL